MWQAQVSVQIFAIGPEDGEAAAEAGCCRGLGPVLGRGWQALPWEQPFDERRRQQQPEEAAQAEGSSGVDFSHDLTPQAHQPTASTESEPPKHDGRRRPARASRAVVPLAQSTGALRAKLRQQQNR